MPAIELAANLRLANSEVKYLGPVNMAGFNQICGQLTSFGLPSNSGNTATITATAEVSGDQANWVAGGTSTDIVKVEGGTTAPAAVVTSLHTLLSPANQGAAFVRLRVEASATGAGTVALWVNTFNS